MFAKCECLQCAGRIEFNATEFQEESRVNGFVFGQQVICPHCGELTTIYLESKLDQEPLPSAVQSEKVKPPLTTPIIRAQVRTTTSEGGCLPLIIGALFMVIPCIGPLIGSMIIVLNENAHKFPTYTCSKCGGKLASANARTCPWCKAQFF
jgi:hypothetical protein